jgi:dihydrofolate reductase
MTITAIEHVTLDGVMQAPAAPDEDTRGGFRHGGWAAPYQDQVMGEYMARGMASAQGALLFGRRTYEHMYSYWPTQTGPITDHLNRTRKYVVSTTLQEPLPWENSALLRGPDDVAGVGEAQLAVLGSGELVQALLQRGLVDALVLTIHPLVLGSGRRLFGDDGATAKLRLAESIPTSTGVIIARYERAA